MWDGNTPLHEWTSKENVTTWLFEQDTFIPAAKLAANGENFSIVSDYMGTPMMALNSNGKKVWSQTLDIFGRNIEKNTNFVPFRYQGQYYDEETGLSYNRFRYYDDSTGQYISQDPIGLAGGNPTIYGYVHDTNGWIDMYGLMIVYRGIRDGQTPYTPSQNDINQYSKSHEKPGFSTFDEDNIDNIWNVTDKKTGNRLFQEAAELDTDKLGPDLTFHPDGGGHVSIRPSDEYLKRNNMTMQEALEDWKKGGAEHTLSKQAEQAKVGTKTNPKHH